MRRFWWRELSTIIIDHVRQLLVLVDTFHKILPLKALRNFFMKLLGSCRKTDPNIWKVCQKLRQIQCYVRDLLTDVCMQRMLTLVFHVQHIVSANNFFYSKIRIFWNSVNYLEDIKTKVISGTKIRYIFCLRYDNVKGLPVLLIYLYDEWFEFRNVQEPKLYISWTE